MAAEPSRLSIGEFHKLYDGAEPAYEYWFGEAVQKPTPTILHGIVQFIIATLLERAGWNTALEVRLKVVPDAGPVPDVIAVQGKFRGPYPTSAPELCVEVLSPGDTLPKVLEKAGRYMGWGSLCVWIIDPEKRTAWTLSQDRPTESAWIPPSGVLSIRATAIKLEELFSEVERKLEIEQSTEQGPGSFGSPEDAALLDEVVAIAYDDRRRPSRRQSTLLNSEVDLKPAGSEAKQ